MGLEAGVVQLLESVLHVLVAHVFDGAGSVFVDIGEADIAGFAHVILQVLPASGGREA